MVLVLRRISQANVRSNAPRNKVRFVADGGNAYGDSDVIFIFFIPIYASCSGRYIMGQGNIEPKHFAARKVRSLIWS